MFIKNDGYSAIFTNSSDSKAMWLRSPQTAKTSFSTNGGFLPVQSGTIRNGHGNLGQQTWYFKNSYVDNSYVNQVNFNNGSASIQYDTTNKCINFVFA